MTKGVIVCVDDEQLVLISLRDQLTRILGKEYDIELAESGEEALILFAELAEDQIEVSLVICDQNMPRMGGVELLQQILIKSTTSKTSAAIILWKSLWCICSKTAVTRLNHLYPQTIKILLTGLANLDHIINAVNHANLYRYIVKPWNETDLGLTVKEALRSYEQYQQLSQQNQILQEINLELQREIAERQSIEARLAHDALHDTLTGLPNRALFELRLENLISISALSEQWGKMFLRHILPPCKQWTFT